MTWNEYTSDFATGMVSMSDLESKLEELEQLVNGYEEDDVYSGDSYYQDALGDVFAFREMLDDFRVASDSVAELFYEVENTAYHSMIDRLYEEMLHYAVSMRMMKENDTKLFNLRKARVELISYLGGVDKDAIESERVHVIRILRDNVVMWTNDTVDIAISELMASMERMRENALNQ